MRQRDWLARGLCDGTARWRLIGTSVMSSPLVIPPNPLFPSTNTFDEFLNVPPRTGSLALEAAIIANNPHVKFVELDSHGVSVLDVTPDEVRMDWFYTSDRADPDATIRKAHSWRTRHDTAHVEPVLF
ncbi:MAG TPA: hypothetical protein VM306_10075 [Lentzea sp.]|nr:hypothetical protein [Lentzea sp.]HUQ55986.1 hypothetical protein [Lentzea sp.]